MRLARASLAIALLAVAGPVEAQDPTRALPEDAVVAEIDELTVRPIAALRVRGRIRTRPYLGGPNRYFADTRLRVGADARFDVFRLYVIAQDARAFGETPGAGSTTGFHQGFLEVAGDPGWLRVGRQEIRWGRQRLIGGAMWGPGRAFDAIRGRVGGEEVALDAFAATRRARGVLNTDDGARVTNGDAVAGARVELTAAPLLHVAPYLLYRYDGPTDAPEGAADPDAFEQRQRHVGALGVELEGASEGLRYNVEGTLQLQSSSGDLRYAYGVAGEVGYRFEDAPLRPGLALGGSVGSGRSGDDLGRFDNFFPSNHRILGMADLISWSNATTGYAHVSIHPAELPLKLRATAQLMALVEPGDAWLSHNGRLLGQDANNGERLLGAELELLARYTPEPFFSVAGGYSIFLPGPAAGALGSGRVSHFAYLLSTLRVP